MQPTLRYLQKLGPVKGIRIRISTFILVRSKKCLGSFVDVLKKSVLKVSNRISENGVNTQNDHIKFCSQKPGVCVSH